MQETAATGLEIAVIGMAGRFPGADDIGAFWENLEKGVESISFLADQELVGVTPELRDHPDFVKTAGGVLDSIHYFDAAFFGYTPAEAEQTAPQIRLFHECVWTALEDAGYPPETCGGVTGLYAGVSSTNQWERLSAASSAEEGVANYASFYLSSRDFLSTLVSYKLNLKGPAFSLNTTCSTSLVAIHLACQGLLSGDCDMALAGGASARFENTGGYLYREGLILSPDGHCRAFDAAALGSIGGNGVGIVVLKRLEDAVEDRDHIYAVIKGSAVNNDGSGKVGYTAPGIEGQAAVIRKALKMAEVLPEDIGYIETHGTGTPLGDVTEVEALKIAFNTREKHFCGLGAVKTNVGHLDVAAGAAGFIKTVLMLEHRMIPPTLHFQSPNPKVDFENSPFYVNTRLKPWEPFENKPLRAGVSSFGIGGTNAHVVLEERPSNREQESEARKYQLILLSAKTGTALEKMTANLADYLERNPSSNLADIAYTLQAGRERFLYREKIVCSDIPEAVKQLTSSDSRDVHAYRAAREENPHVVFMFPGLGSQYVNMGLDLYRTEPVFRQEIDRCFSLLKVDLKEIVFNRSNKSDSEEIHRIEIAQPLVFTFEYALAKLLISWGIRPRSMIGYSFGEYVCACLAGVFSLEDALRIVSARARLLRTLPPGMMLSVPLPVDETRALLSRENQLSVAIDNGPSCVVAGPSAAVREFEERMKEKRLICVPLNSTHAVHSSMMDPVLKEFEAEVRAVPLNPPRIPYISSVTGDWITVDNAVSPAYWVRQLRETVRFSEGLRKITGSGDSLFVEVGPGRDISALVNRRLDEASRHRVVNLVRHPGKEIPDDLYLLDKIGRLWLYGVSIDWANYYAGEKRSRVSLPAYPFERRRYWRLVEKKGGDTENEKQKETGTGIKDWFYIPTWKRRKIYRDENATVPAEETWLIFIDQHGVGDALIRRLKENPGQTVVTVEAAPEERGFEKRTDLEFIIHPKRYDDYESLLRELHSKGITPRRIIHLWGVTGSSKEEAPGFYSLLYLAKALGRIAFPGKIEINVVTDHLQDITGNEPLQPEKATVLGPCTVIPQEYPDILCRSVDLYLSEEGEPGIRRISDQLLEEFTSPPEAKIAAFRGRHRWVREFEPLSLEDPQTPSILRQGGVYMIAGGLGDIGYTLAEYLVKTVRAKVILTGRSEIPPKEMWGQFLLIGSEDDTVYRNIRKLRQLEDAGGEVLYFGADITDKWAMEEVFRESEARFGPVHGIIHAAGIVEGESVDSIENLDFSTCDLQFQAKLYGLRVLAQVLENRKPDFCLLVSSVSTVLGGLGFSAYAAANHFMDAFAAAYNRKNREPWIIVDWEGMNREDTAKAFHLVLSSASNRGVPFEQLVFANGGTLEERIAKWVRLTREDEDPSSKTTGSGSLNSRPELSNPYLAPGNPGEQLLADIWQRFFGIEKIGVTDDLFDLGGDSLKAVNILAVIQKELNVNIPLKAFFDNPTIRTAAAYLTLPPSELEPVETVRPVEKKEYYPLSFNQKRLWFINRKEPHSSAFNTPGIIPLRREVNEDHIEETLRQMMRRHESLRTGFKVVNDQPVQYIMDNLPVPLEKVDLSRLPETEKQAKREEIYREESTRPFDLDRMPLFRFLLVKSSDTEFDIILNIHHIITDGWSEGILKKEFLLFYNGFTTATPYTPEPLEFQYKDFAHWHNRRVEDSRWREEAHRFWFEKLKAGVPSVKLPVMTGKNRDNREGAAFQSIIHNPLKQRLKELARQNNTTLFTLLYSVYLLLLGRFSGQKEVACSIINAGRDHPSFHPIVGFFVNSVIFITGIDDEEPFEDFLKRTHTGILETFEHQGYAVERVFEELKMKYPDIPVSFNMLNIPSETAEDGTGSLKTGYLGQIQDVKFDIEPYITEYRDALGIYWSFKKNIFKLETVEYINNEYVRFLDYFSQDPRNSFKAYKHSREKKSVWKD